MYNDDRQLNRMADIPEFWQENAEMSDTYAAFDGSIAFTDIDAAQRARREKREQALKSRRRKAKSDRIENEKARRGFVTGSRLIMVSMAVVVAVFVWSSAFRIIELKGIESQMTNEIKTKSEQKESLKNQLERVDDKDYIEKVAREKLGMVKSGETIYIFDEAQSGTSNVSAADKNASSKKSSNSENVDDADITDDDGSDSQGQSGSSE